MYTFILPKEKDVIQEGLTHFMVETYWVIYENDSLFENLLIFKSCCHMEQPHPAMKQSLSSINLAKPCASQ